MNAVPAQRANSLSAVVMPWSLAGAGQATIVAALLACCAGAAPLVAQKAALAQATVSQPLVEFSVNESGGRISIADARNDPAGIESIRLQLLETAAAIRRGDYRNVRLFAPNAPAIKILAERHLAVRCVFRPTPRGGELVLLSDDDQVVTAIHQLLAADPPRQPDL